MLSRLLPRDTATGVQPFSYPVLSAGPGRGVPRTPSSVEPAGSRELQELRDKLAEQERVHAKRLAEAQKAASLAAETGARSRAESEIKPLLENLRAALDGLQKARSRMRKDLELEAAQLSMAIARRVLHRELSIDPDALRGLVQAAFERVERQEVLRILIHPDLAGPVREALSKSALRRAEVVTDPSSSPGTFVIETTRGAFDASVDSQMKEIEFGLADRLRSR